MGEWRVIGSDDSGTGAWAGPAMFGAVVVDPIPFNKAVGRYLKDSKQMTDRARREAVPHIKRHALCYAVAIATVEELSTNFGNAYRVGMTRAVAGVHSQLGISGPLSPDEYTLLVDGRLDGRLSKKLKRFHHEPHFVISADNRFPAVRAAAILAKTARNDEMIRLDAQYPEFLWCRNAGYGTAAHKAACEEFGVTKHHRRINRLSKYRPYDTGRSWYNVRV